MGAGDRINTSLESIQGKLRSGALRNAKRELEQVAQLRLSRPQRILCATLANDAFEPRLALELIQGKKARPGNSSRERKLSPEESLEYGVALFRIGLVRQALRTFESLDPVNFPRVYSFKTVAYFRNYDWLGAKSMLQQWLANPALAESLRLSATIDLAIVHLHGENLPDRASSLLEPVLESLGPGDSAMLRWSTLEMLMQSRFRQKSFREGLRYLDQMERLVAIERETTLHEAVIALWRLLFKVALRHPVADSEIRKLRAHLRFHELGRLARDLDFYLGLLRRDEKALARAWFGSPYPSLRAKLLNEAGLTNSDLPGHFDLEIGSSRHGAVRRLDALNGINTFGPGKLKPGQLPQLALAALTTDFYEHPTVEMLYEDIYGSREFRPEQYVIRTAQALRRLRRWLEANEIPLAFKPRKSRYLVEAQGRLQLRFTKDQLPGLGSDDAIPPRISDLMRIIRERVDHAPFQTRDLEPHVPYQRWTLVSRLREACARGLLIQEGAGRGARYRQF